MWQFALPLALMSIVPLTPTKQSDLEMRVRLPAQMPPAAHFIFRAYAGRMEILVGGQRIYRFDQPEASGYLRTHDVALPDAAAGNWLLIRFPAGETAPFIGTAPVLAPASEVPEAIADVTMAPLRSDIAHPAVGAVLAIVGLACIAVSRMRVRGSGVALLWFGAFAMLYGSRVIAASGLPLVLGASLLTARYVQSLITYVIPIPGWLMARAVLGDGWKESLRWQVAAFAAFAPIGIISDIVRRQPQSLSTVNNVLVVIGGIVILLNVAPAIRGGQRDMRVLGAGAFFFLLYALNDNLAGLGLLPWQPADETPGFVVFVACLGYVAVRAFVRGERERLSIEGELTAAREIQRSILPTSMPSVPGLRFDVRYDPASSVAGDFYDFISAGDGNVGLLVADVAGHGVPAALIASMVKIAVSSQSRLAADPAAILVGLNETLRRDVRRAFVTATYLYFETASRFVAVANAGHPSPLLLRAGEFHELGAQGTLLGRFGMVRYEAQSAMLEPGDRIVAWTDGIVEARNARDEPFGDDRFRTIVKDGGSAESVIEAVHRWRRSGPSDDADDLTIVIADVTA
jgi:sigma-B regulation protein RsbU (phosphoserine phosphatase)